MSNEAPMASGMVNPFAADVCTGPYEVSEKESVTGLNAGVLERLEQAVEEHRGGGCQPLVLLTAPRAGYGKTHLLGRMTAGAEAQWLLVPVAFRLGDEVSRAKVAWRGLEALSRVESGTGGWSKLREACAGLVTGLLRGLIQEGRLPCANSIQALEVLAGSAVDIFEKEGPARLIGEWVRKHAGQLRRPMAEMAVQRTGAFLVEDGERWIAALTAQAAEGGQHGLADLRELGARSDEGCTVLHKLLGLWRPVVLLVDHVDGFYRDAEAGLRIASLLLDFAEMDGHPVVLSLNQDVWQATFGHHLPSALEDRLTSARLLLSGLEEAEAREMLRLRLVAAGVDGEKSAMFERYLDLGGFFSGRSSGSVSARAFLRHAARQWEVFQADSGAFSDTVSNMAAASGLAGGAEEGTLGLLPVIQGGRDDAAQESPAAAGADSPFQLLDEPSIFDPGSNALIQQTEGVLHEPTPALPQEDPERVEASFPAGSSAAGAVEDCAEQCETTGHEQSEAPDQSGVAEQAAKMGAHDEETPAPLMDEDPVVIPPGDGRRAVAEVESGHPPADGARRVTRVPGSFEKLREMLDRLRQSNGLVSSESPAGPAAAPLSAGKPDEARDTEAPPFSLSGLAQAAKAAVPQTLGAGAIAGPQPLVAKSSPAAGDDAAPRGALMGRFEALRAGMAAEAAGQPLQAGRLAELVRLAGRRFPLVRPSDHELPGQPGRVVMCWRLRGEEILFTPPGEPGMDFWQAMGVFVAGRMEAAHADSRQSGEPPMRLKVAGFANDRDRGYWDRLLADPRFPDSLREALDVIQLDSHGLASLYAMQKIIEEAESGQFKAAPQQVMSALARELDFFWKRVTRVRREGV
jgi:hypothetical protein